MTELSSYPVSNWRERRKTIETMIRSGQARLYQVLLDILRENHTSLDAVSAALQLLEALKIPAGSDLVEMLGDENPEIRTYAALILGELKDAQAGPALLKALDDPDMNVRFNAIEALGKLGASEAVEPLLAILDREDFFLTFPAIQALGQIGDRRAQPGLLLFLKEELFSQVAAQALGEVGDLTAIGHVLEWLDGPVGDPATAVVALTRILRRSMPELESAPQELSNPAQDKPPLAALGQIAARLGAGGRAKLLASIPRQVEASGGFLEEALQTYYPELAVLLGWLVQAGLQDADLLDGLARLMDLPVARQAAAHALACAGKPAFPVLMEKLQDEDPEVRYAAAQALGSTNCPSGAGVLAPVLIALLDTEDDKIVALAAETLSKTDSPEAFEPLLSHLDHPSAQVRQALIAAISTLDHPDLPKRLPSLLQDPNPLLREAGLRLLVLDRQSERSAGQASVVLAALGDSSQLVRRAAVEALPHFDDPQVPGAMSEAIQDPNPAIRSTAARVLAAFDRRFSLPLLYAALQDNHPWTRLYACRSIAQYADPDSLSYLNPLIYDLMPPVRVAAAEAIGRIGDPSAAAQLQPLLNDQEAEVRQAARRAIDQLTVPVQSRDLDHGLS